MRESDLCLREVAIPCKGEGEWVSLWWVGRRGEPEAYVLSFRVVKGKEGVSVGIEREEVERVVGELMKGLQGEATQGVRVEGGFEEAHLTWRENTLGVEVVSYWAILKKAEPFHAEVKLTSEGVVRVVEVMLKYLDEQEPSPHPYWMKGLKVRGRNGELWGDGNLVYQ